MNRNKIPKEGLLTEEIASLLKPGDLVKYNGFGDKLDREAMLLPGQWYQLVRAKYFDGTDTFIFEGVSLTKYDNYPRIVVDIGTCVKDYAFEWFSRYKITNNCPVEIL